jgi:thiol-disulfide isomerase/thioredoxin
MNKNALLTAFFCALTSAIAFSQGIRFDSTDWKTAVVRAKTEKKMIFIDFFTTWCAPCKRLEKEVFALPDVGSKFNSSFVNLRIDAEKGEGIDLAARFGVTAYPSSVFIKADDETMVYKIVGSMPADKYLAETNAALEALVKDPFVEMEAEYQKGNRTIDFLTKMIKKKMLFNRPVDREVEAYFVSHWVDSFFVKSNQPLFQNLKLDVNGKAFDILMQRIGQVNQSSFYTLQPNIKTIVERNLLDAVKKAKMTRDAATLERVVGFADLLWTYPNSKNSTIPRYKMVYYQHGDDPDKLVQATKEYMTTGHLMNVTTITYRASSEALIKSSQEKMLGKVSERAKMDSTDLNKAKQDMVATAGSGMNLFYAKEFVSILQPYLDFVTDPKAFRLAQEWSKRLTELDETAQNLSIHAQVLSKAGDKTEAVAVQKLAIERAKKENYNDKDMKVLTDLLGKMAQ